ncbi:MAG TPA: hypothetical protein VM100_08995, partial [Longimicrobiales bacterium]|nr:hypothetical protein [Longimicrobiales bacterium]
MNRALRDLPEQTAEHHVVNGKDRVPIRASEQPSRIEGCCLSNHRSRSAGERRHFKFEPSATWKFQVGGEPKPA